MTILWRDSATLNHLNLIKTEYSSVSTKSLFPFLLKIESLLGPYIIFHK